MGDLRDEIDQWLPASLGSFHRRLLLDRLERLLLAVVSEALAGHASPRCWVGPAPEYRDDDYYHNFVRAALAKQKERDDG
jgi:hypothetical protein